MRQKQERQNVKNERAEINNFKFQQFNPLPKIRCLPYNPGAPYPPLGFLTNLDAFLKTFWRSRFSTRTQPIHFWLNCRWNVEIYSIQDMFEEGFKL